MRKTRTLSAQEEGVLCGHIHSQNTIIHRRALIILKSAGGRSAREIAEDVGLHPKTVREVIRGFNERGMGSIFPKKSGRPRKFDSTASDKLIEFVRSKPEDHAIESGVWTLEAACEAAAKEKIVSSIGRESLRRILKRNGLSWKRVKGWIRPSDPAYQQKKALRDRTLERVLSQDDWDVEYTDESWLVAQLPDGAMNPQMGSSWSDVGMPAKVPTSNKKSRVTTAMYAGISIKDRAMYYKFSGRVNTSESIDYLQWRAEEAGRRGLRRLFIIWDNASWHTSKGLKSWLREHNGKARREGGTLVSILMLPKRSPWLNPIEAVFRWLKQRAIFCRIHENLEELRHVVARCIDYHYRGQQALAA